MNESNYLIPSVLEKTPNGERSYDLYSRLLKDNIIFVQGPIDDPMANIIVAQLLFLSSVDPNKDINMYINSPGGSVSAGLGIYDTMQYIPNDVATISTGMSASMAQLLLCAGTKGKRYMLPNSRVMMHQPLGGYQGKSSDIEIYTNEMIRIRENLYKIISKHTGHSIKKIRNDAGNGDKWMSAEDAVKYGMVDKILEHQSKK